jgi:hypothetical protein
LGIDVLEDTGGVVVVEEVAVFQFWGKLSMAASVKLPSCDKGPEFCKDWARDA